MIIISGQLFLESLCKEFIYIITLSLEIGPDISSYVTNPISKFFRSPVNLSARVFLDVITTIFLSFPFFFRYSKN